MDFRQVKRFFQCPGVYCLNDFIFGSCVNLVIIPLHGAYSLIVRQNWTIAALLEIIKEKNATLVITQDNFVERGAEMNRSDFLIAISNSILPIK